MYDITPQNTVNTENSHTLVTYRHNAEIKKEIEKLKAELSALLLERDELKNVICPNIESAYFRTFGALERNILDLQYQIIWTKRNIEMLQAQKNRQEKPDNEKIQQELNIELEEYIERLKELCKKIEDSYKRSDKEPPPDGENPVSPLDKTAKAQSDERAKRIKKLYRNIVKSLHPDVNPNVTAEQMELFHKASEAYENGDLETLEIIAEMAAIPDTADDDKDEKSLADLTAEKERLENAINTVRKEIEEIKSRRPYTLKEILEDPQKSKEQKKLLEDQLEELKKLYEYYKEKLDEMTR